MDKYFKFLSVKILSIIYFSLFFLFLGFLVALILNFFQPPLKDDNKKIFTKSPFILTLEVIITLILIVVSFYFVRKIIKKIPFPFDGCYGFQHSRLQELHGVVFFAPVFFLLQPRLVEKIAYLRDNYFQVKHFYS